MRADVITRGHKCAGTTLRAGPFKNAVFASPERPGEERGGFPLLQMSRDWHRYSPHRPQAQGGSDDIDNAAPLCQNCHARFGANPEKRTEIRLMRDWWY